MSNKINYRRRGQRRDSKMPRWRRTYSSCNGVQGVAKGRRRWKRIRERTLRRTGRSRRVGLYRSVSLPEE